MHLALARKYRPQNFLELIGQDPIVKTLNNAITNDRLHHAYLFSGVRGIGKTSLARILAKSINCANGPTITPCQECENCQSITAGNNLDVIEIDGASNNLVDDVRELREQVKYVPQNSVYKIIIIDEVHMLSNSAFNALLKTLEEPPKHVKFIFATTEPHKIPMTILSRCQKYDFRKITPTLLKKHLKNIADKEKISIDDAALFLIASCSQGSVRDGLSLLDQIQSLGEKEITEDNVRENLGLAERVIVQQCFEKIITEDLEQSLNSLSEIDERGLDLKLFSEDLLHYFRHLILFESTGKMPPELGPAEQEFLTTLKGKIDKSLLLAQNEILLSTIKEITHSPYQKTILEICLVKLKHVKNMIGLTDLVDQIQKRAQGSTTARPNVQSRVAANDDHKRQPTPAPKQQPQATHQKASDWYELVKWITKEKPPVGSLLKEAHPVKFSEKLIEIAFAPKSQTKDIVIERVSTIKDLIKTHFGSAVDLKIIEEDEQKKKP